MCTNFRKDTKVQYELCAFAWPAKKCGWTVSILQFGVVWFLSQMNQTAQKLVPKAEADTFTQPTCSLVYFTILMPITMSFVVMEGSQEVQKLIYNSQLHSTLPTWLGLRFLTKFQNMNIVPEVFPVK